ncbi:uncharacterized protein BXZ73DRAFT_101800 [Epithele typhae]|uniref:uncharacterized protein n=1 Tax=Epithele typhae TaxID=378194 RepID=UPI002008EB0D|nr:uncharacterized protein BXZ73DRAFT_101800 [Epithele typhae]KAH9930426.1 hypothetical protein BXZ73DRAFT_101800 [Epithele typhae]
MGVPTTAAAAPASVLSAPVAIDLYARWTDSAPVSAHEAPNHYLYDLRLAPAVPLDVGSLVRIVALWPLAYENTPPCPDLSENEDTDAADSGSDSGSDLGLGSDDDNTDDDTDEDLPTTAPPPSSTPAPLPRFLPTGARDPTTPAPPSASASHWSARPSSLLPLAALPPRPAHRAYSCTDTDLLGAVESVALAPGPAAVPGAPNGPGARVVEFLVRASPAAGGPVRFATVAAPCLPGVTVSAGALARAKVAGSTAGPPREAFLEPGAEVDWPR